MRVKIYGAGSIGNHLSHASRQLGWNVDLCDIDPAALDRTRYEIFPIRYGQWDDSIRLFRNDDAPVGEYDLIIVGTPPDHHIPLAMAAIDERPQAILIEKPFCTPGLENAQALYEEAGKSGVVIFTGYDHAIGAASEKASKIIRSGSLGTVETLDVEFREFWGGIFSAHPWLNGPADTYLGYWRRGGGASGEHSHAINLWQHFAHEAGIGRVVEVSAVMDFVSEGPIDYDKLCVLTLKTETGVIGRVVQDVVTSPPRKWARVQGSKGFVEWHCGFKPGVDAVLSGNGIERTRRHEFPKTRPDDFILELQHLADTLKSDACASPISAERGLDTMMVIAAAHSSSLQRRSITIDHSRGYTLEALV